MIGKLESGIPHSCKEIDSLIQDLEYPHRLNKEKTIQKLEKIRKINYDLRIFAERMADKVEQLEENKNQLTVTFESWDYDCSDGCCTWYGTSLYLNDKKLPHPDEDGSEDHVGDDKEVALRAVLKELGYNVKIEYR